MPKRALIPQPAGWLDFLQGIPVRNTATEVGPLEGGVLPISVFSKQPRWLVPPLSWVMPWSGKRIVKLDGLGRFVWDLCDGQRRVEQIIDRLAQHEGLTFHEARIALTQHMEMLVRRGVIVLVVSKIHE